jgi:hypothetical protein
MSETETVEPEVTKAIELPPVRRAGVADINECGPWLLPRMCEYGATIPERAIAYLRATIPANDQALVRCGDAMGMCHVEPSSLGHPCRMVVDFVLSKHLTDGVDECCEIYAWMANYAKGHGASGLYRVDDFSDADRSFIRARIGKLTKKESFHCYFEA